MLNKSDNMLIKNGVKKAYPNANYEIVEGYGHLTYSVKNRDEYVKKLKSVERGRVS